MRTPKRRQAFIRRGAESNDIFIEDLRGMVWNSHEHSSMSWNDIAIKASISSQTVIRFAYYETKKPQFRTVFRIMEALDIRLTYERLG